MSVQPSEAKSMKLYNFWRSGTLHRTRIALNLKGLDGMVLAGTLWTRKKPRGIDS